MKERYLHIYIIIIFLEILKKNKGYCLNTDPSQCLLSDELLNF